MINGKGAFTEIRNVDGKTKIITRKVMYTDGFRAFLCVTENVGETEKRNLAKTEYAFTYDVDKKLIYLSEGYRNDEHKNTVREATLGEICKYDAGKIINDGVSLKWLTQAEMDELRGEFLTQKIGPKETESAQVPQECETTDIAMGPEAQPYAEARFRCKNCGRLVPVGRSKCRKCGSDVFEIVSK